MAQLHAGHPFLLRTGVHFCSPSNQQVTSLPPQWPLPPRASIPGAPTPFQSLPS